MPPQAPSAAAIRRALPELRDVPAAQAGLIYRQLLDRLAPAQRTALRARVEMAEDALEATDRARKGALAIHPEASPPLCGSYFERTRPRRPEESGI